ncbi:hypothetical protein KAR91_18560 [Candidatus Pacearchaeota archaeon]|nr:hypothetical protein [Candidatus Pacearchaeota archaeon]
MRKDDKLVGLFWVIVFSIILLGVWTVNVFAGDKWPEVIISSNSVPVGTTLDECEPIDAYDIRYLAITAQLSFNVAGGSDVVVGWYTSPNGDDWDTVAVSSQTITMIVGKTVQYTWNYTPDAMYHKYKVYNGDSVHAISSVTVTAVGSN